jgi:hypothetical protein
MTPESIESISAASRAPAILMSCLAIFRPKARWLPMSGDPGPETSDNAEKGHLVRWWHHIRGHRAKRPGVNKPDVIGKADELREKPAYDPL